MAPAQLWAFVKNGVLVSLKSANCLSRFGNLAGGRQVINSKMAIITSSGGHFDDPVLTSFEIARVCYALKYSSSTENILEKES